MFTLSPDKSNLLNLVRWIGALVVVIGHVDMYLGQFGGGDPMQWSAFGHLGVHSHAAVIMFFVLSGYVVAYATEKKYRLGDYGFRSYFLDRWSRIYSVLLAAICFTVALDYVGGAILPSYHNSAFIPQDHYVLRIMANLFCIQGIWGYRIQLGSNPALWSVGYELIFYLLFGVLYFRRKIARQPWIPVVLAGLILGIIGWKMSAYFVIWLTGVASYYLSKHKKFANYPISWWLVIALIIVANQLLVYNNVMGAGELIRDFAFALVLAFLFSLEVRQTEPSSRLGLNINTYMAGFSFSVYAFHMPIIFLGCSVLSMTGISSHPRLFSGLILTFLSFLVARVFFHLAESRRADFRIVGDKVMRHIGI